MKKTLILLSFVLLGGVIAAALSSNARIRHIIYLKDPLDPSKCTVTVIGKSLLVSPQGTIRATTNPAAPCITAMTFDVED